MCASFENDMAFLRIYFQVLVLSILVSGCFGKDDDKKDESEGWDWASAAGRGVAFAIFVLVCGIISLISWITCYLHTKCTKVKVGVIKVGPCLPHPQWSDNLVFKPEMAVGFGAVSDGFLKLGPTQLVRNRTGTHITDGAKWAVGMTGGKHVFEITWPWAQRGVSASVGVGLDTSPLTAKGRVALVGSDASSWGLDIVKRGAFHNKRTIRACPTDGSYVPDKFFMYVDVDEGRLGYGNDVTYWGEVLDFLPKQGTQALYVMVGASIHQAEISINYKGSAPDGASSNVNPGGRPPNGLPPLAPSTSQAPPTYTEFDENNPSIKLPPGPSQQVLYEAPPAYSRSPTGVNSKKE